MTRLLRSVVPLLSLSILLVSAAAYPAPPPPRPYSGCGVLALKPQTGESATALFLYQEPGVLRLSELPLNLLPRLAGEPEEPLFAVTGRKGGWSRLVYDDAGREAWVEEGRASRYLTWSEFLPGRLVQPLPGMKKELYALRSSPAPDAPVTGALGRGQAVRVLQVEDEWARLENPAGWFRWRDGDDRLTVSLPGATE